MQVYPSKNCLTLKCKFVFASYNLFKCLGFKQIIKKENRTTNKHSFNGVFKKTSKLQNYRKIVSYGHYKIAQNTKGDSLSQV